MEIDSSCYTFKRMEVEKGLFDSSVDATYVITLEGNGRYERIMEQLTKYHPTRVLYIMTNRGYKRCKKNLRKELPRYDLTDAFINVFRHAKSENYNNILVLEDDFIFSDLILDPKVAPRVNDFLLARGNTDFIYLLGCLPFLQVPYDQYHNIALKSGGTHAVIYSQSGREKAIQDYDTILIDDWDLYNGWKMNRYTYYEPLAYQTFPMTDNRKQWGLSDIELYNADLVLRFFKLDLQVEPGYSIFYFMSKLFFYLIVALSIVLLGAAAYFVYWMTRGTKRVVKSKR
jgi:hypothetical protein